MKALLHSMEDEMHSHKQSMVDVDVLQWRNDNDIVVVKEDGTVCRAVFNGYVGKMFVDDVYGIINGNDYEINRIGRTI